MEFKLSWRRERPPASEDEALMKRLRKAGVVKTVLADRGFGPLAPTPGPVTPIRIQEKQVAAHHEEESLRLNALPNQQTNAEASPN